MSSFVLFSVFFVIVSGSKSNRTGRDSYIDAYRESHGGASSKLNFKNPDRKLKVPMNGYKDDYDDGQYSHTGSVDSYYGAPEPGYEPSHSYGPPQHSYGPPRPVYGPPLVPTHNYRPPHSDLGIGGILLKIWKKLKFKLDLILLFKVLMKLILFKKFLSVVGIVGLILFVSWFKTKKTLHHGSGSSHHEEDLQDDEEDDEIERKSNILGDDQLNRLTVYVMEAIHKYIE